MYELEQVGNSTYYIKSPTNIGIYKISEKDVYIIDSGNSKDVGKKILKIIEENGWNIKGIINTHSHADHIGGNKIIQERTNCEVLCSELENCFIKHTILEPSLLYGAAPFSDLTNKFLLAKPTNQVKNIEESLPDGLEYIKIPGHSPDMIGIKTSDNICFLGDALVSEETIKKYHVFYIYNLEEHLRTLEYLETISASMYIPAHVEAITEIKELIRFNKEKINEIIEFILKVCKTKLTFEEILKEVFKHYELIMDSNQFVLVGNTIKAYLTYLYEQGKIVIEYIDNKMYWMAK